MRPNREGGVEQQDSLFRPSSEVTIGRALTPGLLSYLLVNVGERRRDRDSAGDRERESHGLPVAMVRVLPQDDHLEIFRRASVEGIKNLARGREYLRGSIFRPHEICKRLKIWGVELRLENRLPLLGYSDIHCARGLDSAESGTTMETESACARRALSASRISSSVASSDSTTMAKRGLSVNPFIVLKNSGIG